MLQIYFLTVLTNIVAGLTISAPFLSTKIEKFSVFSEKMENRMYRVILGVITFITGLFALLNLSSSSIAIVGDLIPSITAISMGIILIIFYFFNEDEDSGNLVKTVKSLSGKYGDIIGIAGIIVGLIHFFIPTALFL